MQIATLSTEFTRPDDTNAYTANDLVANSTTAGSVTPLSWPRINVGKNGQIAIHWVRLSKSGTTATNGEFRVHFFTASPTVANGDNGAFSSSQAANYIGSADVTMSAFTDGCAGLTALGTNSPVAAVDFPGAENTIYALIEALAAYTPAAEEVFTATIFVERLSERG